MPEGDDVTTDFHDAGPFGLRDRGQVADQGAQQAHLGAGRYDRQPVQGILSLRAQGATLASTASTTVGGTTAPGLARTSVT